MGFPRYLGLPERIAGQVDHTVYILNMHARCEKGQLDLVAILGSLRFKSSPPRYQKRINGSAWISIRESHPRDLSLGTKTRASINHLLKP